MSKRMIGNGMLLIAAMIWGAAFVAQTVGMEYVEPFTFQGVRFLLGAVVLLPVIAFLDKKGISKKPSSPAEMKNLLFYGTLCGLLLFVACSLQQIGLLYTEAGKAGFLTSLYIILVPIASLFFRKKISPWVWVAAVLAMAGLYLLCSGDMSIGKGEIYILLCAAAFAAHILVVDHASPLVDGIRLSSLQFFVCGVVSIIVMFCKEKPTINNILSCWIPIVYAGVLSSGVGYTFQILGQAKTEPSVASLLMSLEAVFSVLFGWIILRQTLTLLELVGCGLVFGGVLLAQLPGRKS